MRLRKPVRLESGQRCQRKQKGLLEYTANKRMSSDNEGPLWNLAPAGSQSFVLPYLSFMMASLITIVDGNHLLNVVKGF